jgi:multidrug efflux system membrane fusion protein
MRHSKILLGSAAVIVVGAGILLSSLRSGPVAAAAPSGPPAMPVPVTSVTKKTIPVYLEYSARTESIREVSLQAKIAGYIQSQPIADGADVKEGELIYKIDERDYRAALDQAKAQAQRNVAALSYAKSNFNRGDELVKTGFLAKDNYDQRASTLGQSEASVSARRRSISPTPTSGRRLPGVSVAIARRSAPWSADPASRSTRWCSLIRSM